MHYKYIVFVINILAHFSSQYCTGHDVGSLSLLHYIPSVLVTVKC